MKLGDSEWIHFDGVAMNLENGEFNKFVKDIRAASIICGEETKKVHDSEHHKYIPNNKSN